MAASVETYQPFEVTIKRVNGDEAERILKTQQVFPDRQIMCIWRNRSGDITSLATRIPHLLKDPYMAADRAEFAEKMQSASEIVIKVMGTKK